MTDAPFPPLRARQWRRRGPTLALAALAAALATAWTTPLAATTERAGTTEPAPIAADVAAPYSGARMVFSDEFDAPALDAERWNTCHWWDDQGCTIVTNEELEWYLPEQVSVADGALHLVADRRAIDATNGISYDYVSGMVSSGPSFYEGPSRFAFTYGTVEVRVKAPTGVGLWSAAWLLAASSSHLPEVDIIEILGEDPAEMIMSFHPGEGRGERQQNRRRLADEQLGDGWVTLRLDWAPGELVWLVNGVEAFRHTGDNVPDEPMYVVLNLAVGGVMPAPLAPETEFPTALLVDYVRIWQV